MSSSAPGASPTNINSASVLPTPNTTFLRELARCSHFLQAMARLRRSVRAAALVSGLSAGFMEGVEGLFGSAGELIGGLVSTCTGFRVIGDFVGGCSFCSGKRSGWAKGFDSGFGGRDEFKPSKA